MNRSDLQSISRLRAEEARVLLQNGFSAGAYYLLGYAVECALKACIAKQIKRYDFPDRTLISNSYTHDLKRLLSLSGLEGALEQEMRGNRTLEENWATVKDWSEQSRYNTGIPEKVAKDLYSAVTARRHGVLSWLRKRW